MQNIYKKISKFFASCLALSLSVFFPFEMIATKNVFCDLPLHEVSARYPSQPVGNEMIGMIINGEMNWNDMPSIITDLNSCSSIILVDGGANYFNELLQRSEDRHLGLNVKPVSLVGDLDSITQESFDKLSRNYPELEVIKFRRDKDFTDLEAALKLVNLESAHGILIFNALGGRIDQTLGNILYLFRSPYIDRVKICTANECIEVLSSQSKDIDRNIVTIPLYQDDEEIELVVTSNYRVKKCLFPKSGTYPYKFNQTSVINDLNLILHCAKCPGDFIVQTEHERIFAISPEKPGEFQVDIGQTISLIPIGGPVHGISTQGLFWGLENATLDKNFIGISNIAVDQEISISVKEGRLLCIVNDYIDENMTEIINLH